LSYRCVVRASRVELLPSPYTTNPLGAPAHMRGVRLKL
jgi:hypothetical protein